MKRTKWSLFPAMLVFLALMQASFALASPGYTGYSGKSSSTCGSCHSGGTAPTVSITGPTTATAGSVNSYTMKITGGPLSAGACDIAVSGGTLGAGTGDSLKNSEIVGGATSPSGSPAAVNYGLHLDGPGDSGYLHHLRLRAFDERERIDFRRWIGDGTIYSYRRGRSQRECPERGWG